jgi:hypothetical protein
MPEQFLQGVIDDAPPRPNAGFFLAFHHKIIVQDNVCPCHI